MNQPLTLPDQFKLLRDDVRNLRSEFFYKRASGISDFEDQLKTVKVDVYDINSKLDRILLKLNTLRYDH